MSSVNGTNVDTFLALASKEATYSTAFIVSLQLHSLSTQGQADTVYRPCQACRSSHKFGAKADIYALVACLAIVVRLDTSARGLGTRGCFNDRSMNTSKIWSLRYPTAFLLSTSHSLNTSWQSKYIWSGEWHIVKWLYYLNRFSPILMIISALSCEWSQHARSFLD